MGLEPGRESDGFRPNQQGPRFLTAHFGKMVRQKGRVLKVQTNEIVNSEVLDAIVLRSHPIGCSLNVWQRFRDIHRAAASDIW